MSMQLKPMITEKAVMMIEAQNTLTFRAEKEKTKIEVKKEVEEIFNVKVQNVRSSLRGNRKYFYIKLKKEFPAIDVATKLGLI